MNRVILFLLCAVLNFNSIFSQDIEGVVIDSTTQEPIPYVHVYNEKFEIGTISNEEGKFILKIEEKNIEITFSHISYQSQKVSIKGNQKFLRVNLLPSETILSEVIVNDEAYKVAKGVFNKFASNESVQFGKAFYRQITKSREKITEFIETFNDISFSPVGIEKYDIFQSRYAKAKLSVDDPYMSFTNFSFLTFSYKIFTEKAGDVAKPFTNNHFEDFTYSIKSYFERDGIKYAIIEYEPNSNLNKPSVSGSFTVNLTTNGVVKFVANTKSSLGVDTLTVTKDGKVIKKLRAFNHSFKWIFTFNDFDGKNQLEYINVIGSFDWMKNDNLETTKLTSTLVVFEKDSKKKKGLKAPNIKQNDIAAVKKIKYNPKFWKDNPVVKRTQSEEDIVSHFEKSNSFGNYFVK